MNIITNTGYYGARKHVFIPAHAYKESAAQLAGRWAREFERGIDGSKIKPGVIKIGVDTGPAVGDQLQARRRSRSHSPAYRVDYRFTHGRRRGRDAATGHPGKARRQPESIYLDSRAERKG